MKITYTGSTGFSPQQQKKVDAKFAKLSKLLDRNGEKEAHVILTAVRHLQRAEITVRYYDHPLVGFHAHSDVLTAMTGAVERLEKQILRLHEKWRDTKRTPAAKNFAALEPAPAPRKAAKAAPAKTKSAKAAGPRAPKQVFKVNHHSRRKPMTLDEAIMEMDGGHDYMVYRDADSDKIQVLVKRSDGHFDLIDA